MGGLIFLGLFVGVAAALITAGVVQDRRRLAFIKEYEFPAEVVADIRREHPEIAADDVPLVFDALRQWLLAARESKGSPLAMPSRAADDAWHRFILATREYHAFCESAYGNYLDHTPKAVASSFDPQAMPRTFEVLEKLEVDRVGGMPLLFAVDGVVRCDRARLWDRSLVEAGRGECSTGELPESDSGCCGCA
jgi:hypothetical protein